MWLRAAALGCLGAAAALVTAPSAQADDGRVYPAEAAIPNSRVFHFTSAIDQEPYTIQVSTPLWPVPKAGYSVIYVLDGELYFPEAAIASDALADKGAVVVGIGHDTLNDKGVVARYAPHKPGKPFAFSGDTSLDAYNFLRDRDFRWPAKPEHRAPPVVEAVIGPEDGHLDKFLQVIEKEIKPRVEAIAPIDKSNQALFGHSLGGLAVVRALFTEPAAFRTFIAASPSLWYDGGAVLDGEKHLADAVTKGLVAPRVLITNGALEPAIQLVPKEFLDTLTPAQRATVVPYNKMRGTWPGMIPGARDLVARLKALPGKPGYKVEYQLIADQDHQSSAFVAIIRAMPFAFLDK